MSTFYTKNNQFLGYLKKKWYLCIEIKKHNVQLKRKENNYDKV